CWTLLEFNEHEYDGKSAVGHAKHWHLFEVYPIGYGGCISQGEPGQLRRATTSNRCQCLAWPTAVLPSYSCSLNSRSVQHSNCRSSWSCVWMLRRLDAQSSRGPKKCPVNRPPRRMLRTIRSHMSGKAPGWQNGSAKLALMRSAAGKGALSSKARHTMLS